MIKMIDHKTKFRNPRGIHAANHIHQPEKTAEWSPGLKPGCKGHRGPQSGEALTDQTDLPSGPRSSVHNASHAHSCTQQPGHTEATKGSLMCAALSPTLCSTRNNI